MSKTRHTITPQSNKIILAIVITMALIFCFSSVSAWEFDNVKSYDVSTQELTLKDSILGLFPTDTIATAKLETPTVNYVSAGTNVKVAEINITLNYDYPDFFKDIKLYDEKYGNAEISRQMTWKYAVESKIEVPDYETICSTDKTGAIPREECVEKENGTKIIDNVDWYDLDIANMKANNYRLGLFTDVGVNERVEFVPNLAGQYITEWATWDSSLNSSLLAYYNFSTPYTNNSLDPTKYPLVLSEATPTVSTGFIGNGLNCSLGSVKQNNNYPDFQFVGTNRFSINLWAYQTSNSGETYLIAKADSGGASGWYFYDTSGTSIIRTAGMMSPTGWNGTFTTSWKMITISCDPVRCMTYVNAGVDLNATRSSTAAGAFNLSICGYDQIPGSRFKGMIDEVAFWNRTLSGAEVTTLYAGGAGMTFESMGGDVTPPVVNLNGPLNGTITSSPYQTFNATFTDDSGLQNATLYIWNSSKDVINTTYNAVSGASSGLNLSYTLPYADNFTWNYLVFDNSSNKAWNSTNFTINYIGNQDDYPKYSALWNTTNPIAYTYNGVYYFNATWIDGGNNGSMTVQFVFDTVSYNPLNQSSVYYINMTNIKAGIHNFTWAAADAGPNLNQTATFTFNITKATATGSIALSPSSTVNNGTATTVTGSESNNGDEDITYTLDRDGLSVSNPDTQTFLTIGERNYTYSSNVGENYSATVLDSGILNITAFGWPFPTNLFNDSSAIGNLTFTSENQTITRYVAIPEDVNVVTLGIMNLSSFEYKLNNTPTGYITQKNLLNTVEYGITGNGTNVFILNGGSGNVTIFNSTMDYTGKSFLLPIKTATSLGITNNGTNFFYLNKSDWIDVTTMSGTSLGGFPVRAVSGAQGQGMTTNGTYLFYTSSGTQDLVQVYTMNGSYVGNFSTIINNPSGIAYYDNYLHILDNTNDIVYVYTTNGVLTSINYTLNPTSNGYGLYIDNVYNKSLYRMVETGTPNKIQIYDMKTYPTNLNISVGNYPFFYYPNQFNQVNNRTNNFANEINSYLSTCSYSEGYCQVPINFKSSTTGILQYSDMYYSDEGIYLSNVTYNSNVYETSLENFTFVFTTGNIIFASGRLNYNGVSYISNTTCVDTVCTVSNMLDIRTITTSQQNNSFYWIIDTFDGTSSSTLNSSIYNQTVSKLSLSYCPTGGNVAMNFSSYDEQTKVRLKPYDFEGNFQFYLGSGSVYQTLNISNSSATDVLICTNYNNTLYTDAIISYTNGTYPTRNHFLQRWPINNVSQKVPLYLLTTASSTSFILQVQDRNLQPLKQVLVNAQRCYPGIDSNETVFIHRTDANGLTIGNLEAQTAFYEFFITNQSQTLLAVIPCANVVPQTTPYTLLFQLGSTYVSPFTNIENDSNLLSTFTFNNTNNVLTWTYIDNSGVFNYSELVVSSLNYSGSNPVVCDSNNTISSGVITCNVSIAGTYSARGYVYRSNQILFDQYVFNAETRSNTAGYYGVFLAFILIIISAFAFKFNEIAGIALINIVIIFCNIIGLVNFGVTFITAMIGISIIIVGVLER